MSDVERWLETKPGRIVNSRHRLRQLYIARVIGRLTPAPNPKKMSKSQILLEALPPRSREAFDGWYHRLSDAASTIKARRRIVLEFLTWQATNGGNIEKTSADEFRAWVDVTPRLKQRASIVDHINAINSLIDFLVDRGIIEPTGKIPHANRPKATPRMERGRVDISIVNERIDVLDKAYSEEWPLSTRRSHLKHLTAFILAADCGMTPYQLAGLTPSQILTDERAIEIPAKQLARRLPLGERAWSALMRWMAFCQREGHPTTEYIFASPEAGKGKLHVPRFAASAKAWLDLRHPSEDGKIGLYHLHLAYRQQLEESGASASAIALLIGPQDDDMRTSRLRKGPTRRKPKSH